MSPKPSAVRVSLRAEDEDLVTAILWEHGTDGIEVQNPDGPEVVLLAYFPDRPGLLGELRRAIADSADARVEAAAIPDVDWVARFRASFRSFAVGGFRIAPPWDVPSLAPGEHLLLVDPGRAFGTGTHETTRLCLRALEEIAREGPLGRMLDVGTGTGILAVAAARLGASPVVAVDVDVESVASARVHARLNGVTVGLVLGDGGQPFATRAFRLVVANLTAPLLRARATEIGALPAPGGQLVLSGLLREELDDIRAAYAALGPARVLSDGEWAALVLRIDEAT